MNMAKSGLILGGVYATEWDKRPHRVLAYDKIELFYDGWWEHKNDWGLNCHNSKVSFYRASTTLFETSSELIRVEPLSEQEQLKYKLVLPFRVCRYKTLNWSEQPYSNMEQFASYRREQGVELSGEPVLHAAKIVLTPLGPEGGHKKSNLISADNGKWFTELELLHKAHNTQVPYKSCISSGIGLYRLGIEKREASYYLGGYYEQENLRLEYYKP